MLQPRWLNKLSLFPINTARNVATDARLVGKLQQILASQQSYFSGQTFLHKTLGYRGVVLFGCKVPFFDRNKDDRPNSKPGANTFTYKPLHIVKRGDKDTTRHASFTSIGSQPELRLIYQVLANPLDVREEIKSENLTYLHINNSPLVSVEGIDYVSHDDVIPYKNMDSDPFKHFLFDSLMSVDFNHIYTAKDLLYAWKKRNEHWVKNCSVHRQLTQGVRITVTPFYIGYDSSSRGQKGFHYWRYTIRIENFNLYSVQLRERNWKILSSMGALETVKGRGVVGEEPVLDSLRPVFQYNSNTSLQSKSGFMFGTFKFEKLDGRMFDVIIPPFPLEVPIVTESS
ncbi:polymerase delta-interacting protein 2 [Oopsacas minuta]|uniref:Polymerase delta-interacting protein 2 n=1 Tax=Oopsacas minuta TaxID=111878 RepID=A0AAV7JDX5_9METZ|nr:polymerase delta-interacting protein 2 [Oopsacas minuta]